MNATEFSQCVTSAAELTSLIGTPSELVIKKQLSALDEHMQKFLAESPFALVGTVGSDGLCDVSPRGDLPSVARVLDSRSLLIGERPGNRRADSLLNIIATGKIGLLFLIPGLGETLRINGQACVTRDTALLSSLTVNGKQPVVGIGVTITECYLQCAKAVIRSRLWAPHAEHPQATARHFAEVLISQTGLTCDSADALAEQITASYRDRLY